MRASWTDYLSRPLAQRLDDATGRSDAVILNQQLAAGVSTPEMIERNPRRFSTLMGLHSVNPWIHDGPDSSRLAMAPRTGSHFE